MKKILFATLLIAIIFFINGCADKFSAEKDINQEIEKMVNSKRNRYDICYDHDTSVCKPFFNFLLKKGLISSEERKIISEKEKITGSKLKEEQTTLKYLIEKRKKEIGYSGSTCKRGLDEKLDDYCNRSFEISQMLYGHHFTERAKKKRQEALNRYFDYVREQLEIGVPYKNIY